MRRDRLLAVVAQPRRSARDARPGRAPPDRDRGDDPPARPRPGRHAAADGPGPRADPPAGLHRDRAVPGGAGSRRRPNGTAPSDEVEALRRAVVDIFRRLVVMADELPDELVTAAENLADPRQVVYLVASSVASRPERPTGAARARSRRRQAAPAGRAAPARARRARAGPEDHDRHRGAAVEDAARLLPARAARVDPARARRGGPGRQLAELRRQIEEANLPEEARREAERELARLATVPPASPEHGMILTYLEWMASLPWTVTGGDGSTSRWRARGPGRGPLRPGEGQGPDPRVPGGQEAPPGARAPGGRGRGQRGRRRATRRRVPGRTAARDRATACPRADPLLRRPAGRGQDQPRPVHRAGARPQVRAHVARRRPRRGRDPRPPPDLHRRAARPHHPGPPARRDARPRLHARRDRQDRRRLARRSVLGAAGGARSRPEPHLRRQLPRRAVRPVAGAVHRDRQHARHDPRAAARPAWRSCSCPGYTDEEKVEIAERYLVPKQLAAHGLQPGRAVVRARGDPRRSSGATRARRACGASSGRSPPSAARWRADRRGRARSRSA